MAFTVQNSTGDQAGANSLVSEADFAAYFADRGVDLSAYTSPQIQAALVKASDYVINRYTFIGYPISGCTTAWPRSYAYDLAGDLIVGIPSQVVAGTSELAYLSLQGVDLYKDPRADSSGRILTKESKKAGPVEKSVEYANASASAILPKFPLVDRILFGGGLLSSTGSAVRA